MNTLTDIPKALYLRALDPDYTSFNEALEYRDWDVTLETISATDIKYVPQTPNTLTKDDLRDILDLIEALHSEPSNLPKTAEHNRLVGKLLLQLKE